jgi:predicted PurR-regulated permease PerM
MSTSVARSGAHLKPGQLAGYTAVVCSIIAIFALCWFLREVLLLAFGAVILAVLIRALARPLMRHTRLRERWAVMTVVVMLGLATTGMCWLFGSQVAAQLQGVSERLPQAMQSVRTWLEGSTAGQFIVEQARQIAPESSWIEKAPRYFAIGANSVGHMFLMLFTGIYLAASPQLYVNGFVHLFPARQHERLRGALIGSGEALRKWLIGQSVSMVSVGALTGLGLWAVGAPLPLAIGIMAGLLEFIPVIGPVLAFIPGVLVALTDGPQVALSAALVLLFVQQLEGSMIMPFAQRWAVELPPAYGLVAVVAFGMMFGFLGILFGSPLAVVLMCLVQRLYLNAGRERKTPAPAD